MEIHQHEGYSQVFHDTEPISRLTHDIYAIQFPSATNENTEPQGLTVDPASTTNNSFVNILVLNRVRFNSGHVERFGAPIGRELRLRCD